MTRDEALEILNQSDHCFLTAEASVEIADTFGLKKFTVQRQRVDHRSPKGLTVPGKNHGEYVYGYDAKLLADRIAGHLDREYKNPMFGRGSGLRYACAHIQNILHPKTEDK